MRKKEGSIYDKDKEFFKKEDSDASSDDDDGDEKKKKRKPKLYKDLVREQVLEKMKDGNSVNDSDDEDISDKRIDISARRNRDNLTKLAYDEEQRALRAEFMDNEEDGSDNDADDWLVKKKKGKEEDSSTSNELNDERQKEIKALRSTSDSDGLKLADPKGEVKDGDSFLLDFITNKRWVDENEVSSDDDGPARPRIIGGEDDDDASYNSDDSLTELDRTDQFESRYNFRFEEGNENSGAALSVVGYSRSALSDTIRRKDDSRKLKRQQRKERKLTERKKKEERLRRLKNAKKEELEERIHKIKSVVGDIAGEANDEVVDEEMVAKLMEGDFDPDKFGEIMSKMYSEDFYNQEDSEWKNDVDVKEGLKKTAIDGEGDVVYDEGEGGLYDDAGEEMVDDGDGDVGEDYDYEMEGEEAEGEEVGDESKLDKKLKDRMLDELYKLDYEDIIDDMPTRFKYRQVESNRFGLRPDEILFAKDTALKEFVSLKRMAPYNEGGEYVPGYKKRRKFRDILEEDMEEMIAKDANEKQEAEAEDTDKQPKKKRRRQKKGKKKDRESASDTKSAKQTDEIIATEDNMEGSNQLTEQKRTKGGRKKKGKKVKKDDAPSKDIPKNEKNESTDNEITLDKNPHKTDVTDKKKKKKRKKKDRNEKASAKKEIPGVSASRLASYGL